MAAVALVEAVDEEGGEAGDAVEAGAVEVAKTTIVGQEMPAELLTRHLCQLRIYNWVISIAR